MAVQTFLVHIDLGKNELQNAVVQNLAASPSTPLAGQIYYDTAGSALKLCTVGGASPTWVALSSTTGTVTSVGATAPITSTGGTAPTIAIPAATASVNGYMTSTYAAKLDGIAAGATANTGTVTSLTASSPLTMNGTAGGTTTTTGTIALPAAASGVSGYLTAADWATFNNKGIGTVQQIIAGSGLTGGTITSTGTIAVDTTTIATKAYVDGLIQGLKWKQSVRAATTPAIGNITLGGGAPQSLDGVLLVAGDRVLVKNQTALPPTQNGIYVVQTAGTGANGTWVRDTDADTWTELISATVVVQEGTTNADTMWNCTIDPGGTLGTTGIQFVSIGVSASVAGSLNSGSGGSLIVQGPTAVRLFTFPDANATVLTTAATVTVPQGGTGATTLTGFVKGNGTSAFTASSTVALGSEVSGQLPIANGGTGSASITSGLVRSNGSALSGGATVLLGSEVSGSLPVANGGTGFTSGAFTRKVSGNCTAVAAQNFTHSLNTTDVQVQVWELSGSLRQVIVQTAIVDANTVNITFNTAPAAGAYRIVVVG